MAYFHFNDSIFLQLQDLKQVSSWSTKERLTTQVIFDQTSNSYVAVFNGKNIRIWQEHETNLDTVRKYKFSSPIHTILTLNKKSPILVMQNGATVSLEWALENRKTWNSPGILVPDEKMSNCQLICINEKIYLCALVTLEHVHSYIVVPLTDENCTEETEHVRRIELKRSSEKLVSHVVLQDQNNAYLLTLCMFILYCTLYFVIECQIEIFTFSGSHGRLYTYPLISPAVESIPGTLISVITAVNTKHAVVMVALNESTIAAYGADSHEEGAVLIIYNIQFKLVQAVQKLKLFTKDAKLWKIEDKLLLAANRHLAIAPYCLAAQRIEAMLGSTLYFKSDNSAEDKEIVVIQESTIADWGISIPEKLNHQLPLGDLKNDVATQVSTFLHEGMSDAAIYHNLMPQLIETKDIASILWCLDDLKDLPEELLIQLLGFCLRSCNTDMLLQNELTANSGPDKCKSSSSKFLDKILDICYTDISLISQLRVGLNFDEILKLLNYLTNEIIDANSLSDNCKLSDSNYRLKNQSYKWIELLIDSHYQHYLLSQDVLKLLDKLNNALKTDVSNPCLLVFLFFHSISHFVYFVCNICISFTAPIDKRFEKSQAND